jgi:hypothetical protein
VCGSGFLPHGACQGEHIDGSSAAAPEDPSTLAHRGAGGEDVVDEQDALAADLPPRLQRKGGAHIALARGGVALALGRRAPAADQPIGANRRSAGRMQRVSEHGRLVVASREEPRPMKRHRHGDVGRRDQLSAGTPQPGAERRCQMQPVAMLEGKNEVATRLVIAHGGAGAVEARLGARAGAAKYRRRQRKFEGQAATGAAGLAEKSDAAPAWRAQRTRLAHRRAADQAARRQKEIKKRRGGTAQRRRSGKTLHRAM